MSACSYAATSLDCKVDYILCSCDFICFAEKTNNIVLPKDTLQQLTGNGRRIFYKKQKTALYIYFFYATIALKQKVVLLIDLTIKK